MRVNIITSDKIARASVSGYHYKAKTWFRAMMGAIIKYQLARFGLKRSELENGK